MGKCWIVVKSLVIDGEFLGKNIDGRWDEIRKEFVRGNGIWGGMVERWVNEVVGLDKMGVKKLDWVEEGIEGGGENMGFGCRDMD